MHIDPRNTAWLLRAEPVTLRDLRSCVSDEHYVYNCVVIGEPHARLIAWQYNCERRRLIWRLRRARRTTRAVFAIAYDVWKGRHL